MYIRRLLFTEYMGDKLYLTKEIVLEFLKDIDKLKVRKMTHDQIRLMFEVLLYGGMRISEVLQITPSSLVGGNKIIIQKTKGGIKRCKCSKWTFRPLTLVSSLQSCAKCNGTGKYRVPATLWLIPEIYNNLLFFASKCQKDQLLFPITRAWAWHYADTLMQARTHTFRHTFLTWMLETEKFNIRDIMQKARHKSLAVTSEYIEKNTDYTQSKENKSIDRVEGSNITYERI